MAGGYGTKMKWNKSNQTIFHQNKTIRMSKQSNTDKGQPSGNIPLQGTGIPQQINDENMPQDERMTNEYTNDDEDIKDSVRTLHPNRNVDKGKQPGIGGY
jgi:hypothetical protein